MGAFASRAPISKPGYLTNDAQNSYVSPGPIASRSEMVYSTTSRQPKLEREGTAELVNDPRFYRENVLEKRLVAFEALAIITQVMSEEACKQCFELSKEYIFRADHPGIAIMQAIGFSLMVSVMFMSTVATAVLSLQLFFTIRLITAGPTGFDKAARFYADKRLWRWRERGIFGVKYCLSTFILSTGFMLWVKFYTEGMPEDKESSHRMIKHGSLVGGSIVFFVLASMSACIVYLVRIHQQIFDESYTSVDTCVPVELRDHFLANQFT